MKSKIIIRNNYIPTIYSTGPTIVFHLGRKSSYDGIMMYTPSDGFNEDDEICCQYQGELIVRNEVIVNFYLEYGRELFGLRAVLSHELL